MLNSKKKSIQGNATSRTAIAFAAAAFLIGGSVTEASARSRHHHRHHHNLAHAKKADGSWRDAKASVGPAAGHTFSGIASFYGNDAGNKTASGQRFNENAMTAAHRSLPFGTKLRVTRGDRSVVVTINDRGPFIRGRVLDLSTGAARVIGLTGSGIGHVTAEVIS